MTRVKVFIDYQNVYHSARRSFGLWNDHPIAGHVRPLRLGVLLKQLGDTHDPNRELIEVRVYRGEPTNKSHPTLQAAFQRQVAGWRTREPSLVTTTRPLRYNATRRDSSGRAVEWDAGEEKGIDVLIALDMALGAERDEYDVAILCSGDTDLVPAIDSVIESGKWVENAVWQPDNGYGRPLRSTKANIWRHFLGSTQYGWVHDPTDYTVDQGDRTAL
jgi:uncharacterized LabA/DUF88 family protein